VKPAVVKGKTNNPSKQAKQDAANSFRKDVKKPSSSVASVVSSSSSRHPAHVTPSAWRKFKELEKSGDLY
jgi:hypothetical protein